MHISLMDTFSDQKQSKEEGFPRERERKNEGQVEGQWFSNSRPNDPIER